MKKIIFRLGNPKINRVTTLKHKINEIQATSENGAKL